MTKKSISDENYSGFRKLTHEKVVWLIENYHTMTTKECALILGIKDKTVTNYAYRLNLSKSPEHISMLRQRQAVNTNNKRWRK